MTYYDDNFGTWDIRDEDDVSFYHHVQATNVEKTCKGCGKTVKIQPHYAICNSCATKKEQGLDF